ncbi:hypothetical protein Tco_0341444 [Tanacetum coccineum]
MGQLPISDHKECVPHRTIVGKRSNTCPDSQFRLLNFRLRLDMIQQASGHHQCRQARRTFMQKTPEECYDLIENMTAHHNHWETSTTRDETSRTISSTTTTESPEVVRQLEMMIKNFLDMIRQIQSVKSANTKCETYGGPHSFTEFPAVGGYTQEAAYATTGSLPSNTIANPRGDLKAITTRSGVSYDEPTILPTSSPLPKGVIRCIQRAHQDKVTKLQI